MKIVFFVICLLFSNISLACEEALLFFCFDFGSNLYNVIEEFRDSEAFEQYSEEVSIDLIVNTDNEDLPIHTLYRNIISYASLFCGTHIPEKTVVSEVFEIMSENKMRFLRYDQVENQYKEISCDEALLKIAIDLYTFAEHAPSA